VTFINLGRASVIAITKALHVVPTVDCRIHLSSSVAFALNVAAVGASANSTRAVQPIVVSPAATSHTLSEDAQSTRMACLAAGGFVSAERSEIYAAGFEQFVDSRCIAP
jgi:hypothetical protein